MRGLVLPVLIAVVLALAACGSSSSNGVSPGSSGGTVHLAKTKFVLHAGLALGAFHRWIYKPFKAGDFNHPFSHKLALIKAVAAGAFVLHEVRLARVDAAHSKLLSRVVLPLLGFYGAVRAIHGALAHRHVNAGAINSANSSADSVHSASSAAGQPITETTAGAPI